MHVLTCSENIRRQRNTLMKNKIASGAPWCWQHKTHLKVGVGVRITVREVDGVTSLRKTARPREWVVAALCLPIDIAVEQHNTGYKINFALCPTAGCCHLANLKASSQSHCLFILKDSLQSLTGRYKKTLTCNKATNMVIRLQTPTT